MSKHKNAIEPTPPYWMNPDIVFIDLQIKGEPVVPGTLLRIKHDRKPYTFIRMCYNQKLKKEWIDLRSANGDWISVYPNRLVGLFRAKKSRIKKQ